MFIIINIYNAGKTPAKHRLDIEINLLINIELKIQEDFKILIDSLKQIIYKFNHEIFKL